MTGPTARGGSGASRRGRRAVLAALALTSAACGDSSPTEAEPDPVVAASLSLDPTRLDVYVGVSRSLVVTARDAGGAVVDVPVTWTSSDEGVARVSASGVVTAWGHGDAEIGATSGSARATLPVTVTGLEEPLRGILNEDFFYTNYVDQATGPQVRDYTCGPKSYDGHRGVDIVLPHFARMDEGVDVVAAAPGTVVAAHDGEFDRNKEWSDAQWNFVAIDHDGQLETVYGHLRRGTVAVSVGETVAVGTKLGQVGSSGRSDMPHLHLELRRGGVGVDPYGGGCSSGRDYFRDPLAYQDGFRVIGSGISDLELDLDLVKDPAPRVDRIDADDERVSMWVHLHNSRDRLLQFRFERPDGATHGTVDVQLPRFYSMSWWWAWWSRSSLAAWPGTWTVEAIYSGSVIATERFELAGPVAAAARAGPPGARSGSGGGAARADLEPPGGRD